MNKESEAKFPISDLLRLHFIDGLSSSRVGKLIAAFKTPERIYRATVNELIRVDGFDKTLANRVKPSLSDENLIKKVDDQLSKLERYNAKILTIWDDEYPVNLRNIYNAPLLLFVRGEILPEDSRSVAVIGSRKVSDYGTLAAERIAGDLASKGVTVVSGMAAGIDSHAHWGALKSGGRTIAVLGCGVETVYPASNNSLYKEIIENGAVISEFEFGTKPWPGNFPARNRIISGLSLGTLIVEAPKKSGALITARWALEQNREVFAIPGNITSDLSEGSNALIRDSAAKLVLDADDILEELRIHIDRKGDAGSERDIPPVKLSSEEEYVFGMVENEPVLVDTMSQKSGQATSKILPLLLTLELKGVIRKLPGSKYVRV